MKLDYVYKNTPQIEKHLQNLEVLKRVIELLPQLPHVEENLRRESLLKSSLFSARIEGNKLRFEDIAYASTPQKDLAKIEVFNILKALQFIHSAKTPKRLSLNLILALHRFVLANISPNAGQWRSEPSAIFNQAGMVIYMPPPPAKLFLLMKKLIKMMNESPEPGPINAAIGHFTFEKIHPFLDGNGRVGRLLAAFILKSRQFGFRGIVSLEEYLDEHRQIYYDLLSLKTRDISPFVEFFLEALLQQAEKSVSKIKNIKTELPEDQLFPRRREILNIIWDHRLVSFDFIRRRFIKIADSTIHYDLKCLVRDGFIKKIGHTRGTLYTPK